MIKVCLFDIDGIVIAARLKYFSDRLREKYGVSKEQMDQFFSGEFEQAMRGKIDLKDVLPELITQWNFPGTVDDLFSFWWEDEKTPNAPVLEYIDGLRTQGIKCFLASDQEKNRAQFLLDEVGLRTHFDGWFLSCFINLRKRDPQFFRYVIDHVGIIEPPEILFWDDKQINLDSASQMGIKTELYTDFEDFRKKMASYEL